MYTRKSTTLTLNKQCSMIQKAILIHLNELFQNVFLSSFILDGIKWTTKRLLTNTSKAVFLTI